MKPYFDPEFDTLRERIYGPPCRVCIDNESCEDCTVVEVDSVNKQGLLLEVVQALTDVNLVISKSYISSDAEWFMDVFHVKDEHGNKLTKQGDINYIQQTIGTSRDSKNGTTRADSAPESGPSGEHTAIEITGTDRPGLFSEISAALADLRCNIVEAHAWSHNARLACVAYISDQFTDARIDDPNRLATIEDHLTTVLRATTTTSTAATDSGSLYTNQHEGKTTGTTMTSVERRLHQLMLSVRDFDEPCRPMDSPVSSSRGGEEERRTIVSIESCNEKGYSLVSIKCRDRPRLMFDTVCTLTDMQYVIFHASASVCKDYAFQEYFIRHVDGCTLNTEGEKERVAKCLVAAIERRVCEGVRLQLRAANRVGLLSDITRVLRENGLVVVRADIETQGEKATNDIYVRGISGSEVDMEFVESMRREIHPIDLQVKNETPVMRSSSPEKSRFSIGDILKSQIERFSHNFTPIN